MIRIELLVGDRDLKGDLRDQYYHKHPEKTPYFGQKTKAVTSYCNQPETLEKIQQANAETIPEEAKKNDK